MPDFKRPKTVACVVGMATVVGGLAVALVPAAGQAASTTVQFAYTGATQTWTVPSGVSSIAVEVEGAQGGGDFGGFGGAVRAALPVTPGEQLLVNVGGRGAPGVGGFNGGGGSAFGTGSIGTGQGGGGASDIRTATGTGDTRLVVAGGGGGGAGGPVYGMGGSGTDQTGESGESGDGSYVGGGGGTAAAPGAGGGDFAGGGSGSAGGNGGFTAGGGGGGYFGGGGGGGDSSGGSPGGGGAGSSHATTTATAVTFVPGAETGDGSVTVSWGGPISNPGSADASYSYTGAPQLYHAADNLTNIAVRLAGGQGGNATSIGGYGADVSATVPVVGGQVIAVLVGGHGGPADACGALSCGDPGPGNSIGGYNGGGTNTFAGAGAGRGSGGGGATDIRVGSWKRSARVLVAGGGGGSATNPGGTSPEHGVGGAAKGTIGADGSAGDGAFLGGGGGTETAGGSAGGSYASAGSLGQGGAGGFSAGSGGGGWYGGGGGGGDSSGGSPGGGGAGSSFAEPSVTKLVYDTDQSGGDGSAAIHAGTTTGGGGGGTASSLDGGTFIGIAYNGSTSVSEDCTTAFGAHDAKGTLFMLGAKHCADASTGDQQNNNQVAKHSPLAVKLYDPITNSTGQVLAASITCAKKSNLACLVPDDNGQTGDFFAWHPDSVPPSAAVQTGRSATPLPVVGQLPVGQITPDQTQICHFGAGSATGGHAEQCGTLMSNSEQKKFCATIKRGCPGGVSWAWMPGAGGDSGGPVYSYSDSGVDAVGIEITAASYCVKKVCQPVSGFVPIKTALNRLGLTLNQ